MISDRNNRRLWGQTAAASWLLGCLFMVVLGACGVKRVLLGGVGVSDLAIYHTAFLNSFKGRLYFSWLHPEGMLLYQHFDPIGLLLLPFYAWLGNAAWPALPISMAAAGGLTFPAVARIGRQEGLPPVQALILPAILLFNPVLHNAVWYDFHPVVFALPLLVWGWAFLREGRVFGGSLCWALAILCKENVPLTVGALGVALAVGGKRRVGLTWAGVGLGSFLLIVGWIMPSFREWGQGNISLARYAWLGQSAGQIAWTLLSRPVFVAERVFGSLRVWEFLLKLVFPLGCLALFSPQTLMGVLPELGILLPSSFSAMQTLKFHYPIVLSAVLIIASARGLAWLVRPERNSQEEPTPQPMAVRLRRPLAVCLCALAALASLRILYTDGRSLPFLKNPVERRYYEPESRKGTIHAMADLIPTTASLSLPLNLVNPIYPFAERPLIAFLPERSELADYVIFDAQKRFFGGHMDPGFDEALERFRHSGEHEIAFSRDGFLVFQRRQPLINDPELKREQWARGGRFAR